MSAETTETVRRSPFARLNTAGIAGVFALTACGESAADEDGGAENGDAEASENSDDVITLTGVPAEDATHLEAGFELLMEVLEEETGREVEFSEVTDYNAVIESLIAGQADMAIGSPFTYVRAGDQGAEVELLGGRVEEQGEEAGYVSYALVPSGSDIEDLEDVEDGSACYVEQGSTSGYLYPSAGMIEAGLNPMEDVEPQFPGSHDGAVLAMLDGQCDVAFAYDSMVTTLLPDRGELEEEDYEIIWESPMIPAAPIFMNAETLDEELQEQLSGIFSDELINVDNLVEAGYCDSAEECSLPEGSYEYTPVEDDLYDGIREVCEITEAEACNS